MLLSLPSSLPLLAHLLNLRVHLHNLRHKKLPVVRFSLPSDFPLLALLLSLRHKTLPVLLLSLPGSLPLLALLLSLRHKTLPVVMLSLPTSPRCRSKAKCSQQCRSHLATDKPRCAYANVCFPAHDQRNARSATCGAEHMEAPLCRDAPTHTLAPLPGSP